MSVQVEKISAKETIVRLVFLAFILPLGCETAKQNWDDWMSARPGDRRLMTTTMPKTSELRSVVGPVIVADSYHIGDGARTRFGFDLEMRNPDFPETYIAAVHVDLTNPHHWVEIVWTGPLAELGPVGPWRSTPGRGADGVDCNEPEVSNTVDTLCTPKGVFAVAGFADHLRTVPTCHYATWVLYAPRYIAMHSHTELPSVPASSGCIRLPREAAKLIHNNSRVGLTLVSISGTWRRH